MAVLVIADHDGSTVRDTTNKTVTAALGLSSDVDVLVLGQGAQAAADSAAKIAGVRKVLLAESAGLGKMLAEAVEATVLPLMATPNRPKKIIARRGKVRKRFISWSVR